MTVIRFVLHGLFLTLANVTALVFSVGILLILKPEMHLLMQLPMAMAISVTVFVMVNVLLQPLHDKTILLKTREELLLSMMVAFILAPAILAPFHFVLSHPYTLERIIRGIWLFQLPANLVAVGMVNRMLRLQPARQRQSRPAPATA